MNSQIALLLILSVVGISVRAFPLNPILELQEQYKQLDEVLKDSGAENLSDGIEVATKYLETLKENGKSSSGGGNLEPSKAVEEFLQLEFILSANKKCSEEEYEAFQQIVAGVQQFDESTSKIALFVMEATIRLANDCQQTFRENFKNHLFTNSENQEQAEAFRFVDGIMDEVTKAHFGGNSSPSVDEMDEKFDGEERLAGKEDAEVVFNALQKVIADSNDRRELIKGSNRSELERIYENYLIMPCNRYAETLGADVFVPAEMVPMVPNHTYNEDSDDMRQFLSAWAHYQFCNTLVDSEDGNAHQFFDELFNFIANKN